MKHTIEQVALAHNAERQPNKHHFFPDLMLCSDDRALAVHCIAVISLSFMPLSVCCVCCFFSGAFVFIFLIQVYLFENAHRLFCFRIWIEIILWVLLHVDEKSCAYVDCHFDIKHEKKTTAIVLLGDCLFESNWIEARICLSRKREREKIMHGTNSNTEISFE